MRDLAIFIPESRLGVADQLTDVYRQQNNFTAQGIFSLALEQNLGLMGNGLYGYDTVALSYLGSGLPSLDHQVVAGIATQDFWMGQFGLNPAASNFSSFNNPVQSYSKEPRLCFLASRSYVCLLAYIPFCFLPLDPINSLCSNGEVADFPVL
jgi:hypothetical protein